MTFNCGDIQLCAVSDTPLQVAAHGSRFAGDIVTGVRSLSDAGHSFRFAVLVPALTLVLVVVIGACAAGELKALPLDENGEPDPVHVVGQDVWAARCSTCHGSTGNGGTGPKLNDGRIAEKYPELSVQTSIIANGVGGRMPAFRDKLSSDEIEAVARYTREVLS